MAVRTDAISFPSSAKGLEQITQVLVTNFGDQYENVRTFCLSRPNSDYPPYFRCDWLVGMSARQGGAVRVGCGHYGWHFGSDDDRRVKKLAIDIEVMCMLPAEGSKPIMQWLAALPYPWCSNVEARESIPANDALQPIESFLRRMETRTRPSLEGDQRRPSDVGNWHKAAEPGCPLDGRFRGESGHDVNSRIRSRINQLRHGRVRRNCA